MRYTLETLYGGAANGNAHVEQKKRYASQRYVAKAFRERCYDPRVIACKVIDHYAKGGSTVVANMRWDIVD